MKLPALTSSFKNGSMTKKKYFTITFYYPIIVGSYNALDFSLKNEMIYNTIGVLKNKKLADI